MNRKTRHGVFETNSSSSHSISIASGEFVPDTLPVDEGVCRIYPGEFGWEVEEYQDSRTKASYALTFCKSLAEGGEFTFPPTKAPECEAMLKEVIMAETGARDVEFVHGGEDDWHKWGYIDHQSHDVCEEAFASKETLRAFIFNPKSILRTDNDNH